MKIKSKSDSNLQQSNGIAAVCDVSCTHNPIKLGYIDWFTWADKQEKQGKKQKQCPICKKWFYPCEYEKL